MTAADRIEKVREAARALPAALKAARSEPENQTLWAEVEQLGAIIHRQSRLLAGKPRGG